MSKILKYSLLKQKIVEKINNEDYIIGGLIPSERELMELYQMSRITVRKAIEDLVNEGYLYRIQGKGTYVKNDDSNYDLFSIASCSEDISKRGMTVTRQVLSSGIIPADKMRLRRLRLEAGAEVYKLERVYFADGIAINYTTTYLPAAIFRGIEKYDFATTSLYSVLENEYGVKITTAKRTLEAILAHEETAEYLEVKEGEPLILFRCVTMGELNGSEIPIETFKCRYRTDVHKFYIDQVRK